MLCAKRALMYGFIIAAAVAWFTILGDLEMMVELDEILV